MPFTDIAVAIQISFTYFTVIYLTGTGGLFSERSGIVNIGLEGLMIIGTVTGAFGVRFFTGTLSGDFSLFGLNPPDLGLVWGPLLGLLFGALCGAIFASLHAVATADVAAGRRRDPERYGTQDAGEEDRPRHQTGGPHERAVEVRGCRLPRACDVVTAPLRLRRDVPSARSTGR